MHDENSLDQLLRQRQSPPPATMLAERIIASAKQEHKTQPKPATLPEVLRDLFLPKPLLAYSLMLVFGFALGSQLSLMEDAQIFENQKESAISFLYDDGDML